MAIQIGDYQIYQESLHDPATAFLNPLHHNVFLMPIRQGHPIVRQSKQ